MIKQLFERRSASGSLRRNRRGQSLVEFALSLPVLLLILAATLEVGNVLTQYNRVQIAAREGARFGAAGGTDDGVEAVVKQAAAESLNTDETQMDIWVVRPVIDAVGSWSWEDWAGEEKHVHGLTLTNPLGSGTVLNDLTSTSSYTDAGSIDGERFVIVVVRYDADTILNLPFFNVPGESGGRVPVWAYTVLRQEITQEAVAQLATGCSAYPIAIYADQITGLSEGDTFALNLNVPGGSPTDQYGFLSWNAGYDLAGHLNAAMSFPGTSLNATEGYNEWGASPVDTQMHRTDMVLSNPGTVADASAAINNHVSTERTLRVILYSAAPSAADPPLSGYYEYEITGFAIVRIDSYAGNLITFEFVRVDSSCGFEF